MTKLKVPKRQLRPPQQTYQDLISQLQEMPDHYLRTPLTVYLNDCLVADACTGSGYRIETAQGDPAIIVQSGAIEAVYVDDSEATNKELQDLYDQVGRLESEVEKLDEELISAQSLADHYQTEAATLADEKLHLEDQLATQKQELDFYREEYLALTQG